MTFHQLSKISESFFSVDFALLNFFLRKIQHEKPQKITLIWCISTSWKHQKWSSISCSCLTPNMSYVPNLYVRLYRLVHIWVLIMASYMSLHIIYITGWYNPQSPVDPFGWPTRQSIHTPPSTTSEWNGEAPSHSRFVPILGTTFFWPGSLPKGF